MTPRIQKVLLILFYFHNRPIDKIPAEIMKDVEWPGDAITGSITHLRDTKQRLWDEVKEYIDDVKAQKGEAEQAAARVRGGPTPRKEKQGGVHRPAPAKRGGKR